MRTTPVLLAPDDVLTTAEVAERLKTSKQTIARWVEDGTLTPFKRIPGSNGAYLFDAAEVDRVRRTPRPRKPRSDRGRPRVSAA